VLTTELLGRNPGFCFAENTVDLFVGKTRLHGDVLTLLMKTLLTSECVNQREQVTESRNAAVKPGCEIKE
jgi:hypothetical protein